MARNLAFMSVIAVIAMSGAARAQATVDQQDKKFSQTAVTVPPGGSVSFQNSDTVTHDVSIRNPDGSRMMSTMERPGEHHVVTFTQPGQYDVQCLIHPKMKMSVMVQ